MLTEAVDRARAAGVTARAEIVHGRVSEALAALAEGEGAQLIAVGSYGERPLTRADRRLDAAAADARHARAGPGGARARTVIVPGGTSVSPASTTVAARSSRVQAAVNVARSGAIT